MRYSQRLRATTEAQLAEFHSSLLTEMMARTTNHSGLTDSVSGDRYHASHNGAKTTAAGFGFCFVINTAVQFVLNDYMHWYSEARRSEYVEYSIHGPNWGK